MIEAEFTEPSDLSDDDHLSIARIKLPRLVLWNIFF